MSKILTKKERSSFVENLPKHYIWHNFNPKRMGSIKHFVAVVRDDKIYGSIHVNFIDGKIHGFTQNGKRQDVMNWTPRYSFSDLKELSFYYKLLLKKIKKTNRTRL